jgi:hypothetical protein
MPGDALRAYHGWRAGHGRSATSRSAEACRPQRRPCSRAPGSSQCRGSGGADGRVGQGRRPKALLVARSRPRSAPNGVRTTVGEGQTCHPACLPAPRRGVEGAPRVRCVAVGSTISARRDGGQPGSRGPRQDATRHGAQSTAVPVFTRPLRACGGRTYCFCLEGVDGHPPARLACPATFIEPLGGGVPRRMKPLVYGRTVPGSALWRPCVALPRRFRRHLESAPSSHPSQCTTHQPKGS